MPVGCAKLLKAMQETPRAMWILAHRAGVGGLARPVVFYKPPNGAWRIVYSGDDVASDQSVVFTQGVRNPLDPRGMISVSASVGLTGPDDYELRAQRCWARSTDGGLAWSYPGIATSTTEVESESHTNASHGALYDSPDDQAISPNICSPAPGLVCFSGKKRTGTKHPASDTYYEYDLTVLTSIGGGALAPSSSVMPINRYDDDYDVNQGNFYPIGFEFIGLARGADPHPLYGQRVKYPAKLYAGVMQLRYRNYDLGTFDSVQYLLTVDTGGVGGGVTPMPFGPLSETVGTTTLSWDGEKYYFGGRKSDGIQYFYSSESLDGPWSSVFVGGTSTFFASAARRPGYLVVAGKGTTTDGGQTWQTFPYSFTAVGWFGTRFYGITNTQLYSSRNGVHWDLETLPAVTGLQALHHIFGG